MTWELGRPAQGSNGPQKSKAGKFVQAEFGQHGVSERRKWREARGQTDLGKYRGDQPPAGRPHPNPHPPKQADLTLFYSDLCQQFHGSDPSSPVGVAGALLRVRGRY